MELVGRVMENGTKLLVSVIGFGESSTILLRYYSEEALSSYIVMLHLTPNMGFVDATM